MYRRLWQHRGLIVSFTYRQYQLRYRQSMVGFVWAVLPIIATLFAGTLVFHKMVKVDTGGIPYPIFTLAALVPWTFFSNGLGSSIPAVLNMSGMVTRLGFPRGCLPLSMIGTAFIDLAVSIGVYVAAVLLLRTGLPWTIVWVPVLLMVELLFLLGLTFLFSALNVFARDIKLAVPIILQFWLFVTPVMYPLSAVPPGYKIFFELNPMTGIVQTFRGALILGVSPNFTLLIPSIVIGLFTLVIGSWYFSATEARFADAL